ncbi:MAG: hypothetical protein HND52_08065 [Ignavibacteriae bacterium]|nr:hypothetical protein [Ignavibacteriota bacterium]NOG97903.1 hypothetical protein [Ignavibacteriota bacterium]
MFKRILITTSMLLFFLTASKAQDLFLSGYARTYIGALTTGESDYSILQNTFSLNFEHSRDNVYFKVNPFLYHYSDDELELGLRQAYMDLYFDSFDIRFGKQQIIWGKADGVFITDIVSPKDMREFLLPDFNEIRVGVTSLKFNYYYGNNTFELVWIPVFTPTQMPDNSSIWSVSPDYPLPYSFNNSNADVQDRLSNSELFVKYSLLSSAIDFELMAGYSWDDDPTFHSEKIFNPALGQVDSVVLKLEHHRLTTFGGSFSTTLGPIVLRGEGAGYSGKYFQSVNPQIPDGTEKKDYLHYLFGIDYSIGDLKLSSQFIQQAILNYNDYLQNDEYENTLTFLATIDFLRETLNVELFSYIGLNESDALVRPKITYDFADGFEMQFGANLFFGDKGQFGRFDKNDMIYTKLKYSF